MNKEKVATIINKTATLLEAGKINNKQAIGIIAKLTNKLKEQGKTHTANALNNIIAEDTEEETKEAENIQKAIQKIYQKRNDFIKIKNKRVKQVFTGLTGPDIINMRLLPFIEMIANVEIK